MGYSIGGMIHSIPLTEYTGVIDSRFHEHITKEIADPEFRLKFYTLDGLNGLTDGSDVRVLSMFAINKQTGDAKVVNVVVVRNDPVIDMLAVSSLAVLIDESMPGYKEANVVVEYTVDGRETVYTMIEFMKKVSNALGIKIEDLKNSTREVAEKLTLTIV